MFDFEAIVVEIEMKVRKLIGENRRLRVEAEEANERCRQLQEQVDKQTQKGDSVEIRLKINQLIRSIDKSLALINKSE